MVVTPSVNITITLALVDDGSKRASALVNASAWLVLPPEVKASTAELSVATEVISLASAVAVFAKLTMPIWLPPPILPS